MIYFGDDKMPDLCNRDYPFHYATALNLLAKMGVDIDLVDLMAVGEYENYKGEVLHQEPSPGTELRRGTRIMLEVGFPSAVDNLPYQFFYGLAGKAPRGKDWELNARRMMAPYDASVIRYEAAMRYQALKFSFGVSDDKHLSQFLSLFAFDRNTKTRDIKDAALWASIMPSFHQWGGNPEKVADVLQLLFGYRFRIIENITSEYEIPEGIRYRLGTKSGRLGRESIIGRSFAECDSTYQVILMGIKRQDMADFLPGRANRKKLEWALSLCMPNDLDYRISFEVENRAAVVGKKDQGTFLGYSTHLQRTEDIKRYRRRDEKKTAQ